jgi:hypothetical protein
LQCPLSAINDRRTAVNFHSMSGSSTHLHGTHVPVEEPFTARICLTAKLGKPQYARRFGGHLGIPAESLIDGRALVNWGAFRGVLICAICGASLLG